MSTMIERIARRITATNDINIVESVIDGGRYDKNEAWKSIKSIIEESNNQRAMDLLEQITKKKNASITAGANDLIKQIKQIASGNSTVIKALLAALIMTLPAGAADSVKDSINKSDKPDSKYEQVVSKQPIDEMCNYLEEYIKDWAMSLDKGLRDFKWNDKREVMDRRGTVIFNFIRTLKKQSKAKPNATLEQAFNSSVQRLNAGYDAKLEKIVKGSFEEYKKHNPDASTMPCYLPGREPAEPSSKM